MNGHAFDVYSLLYSTYTENMPIQLTMFSDRLEIRNPGGLYGRMTLDQLGKVQPDTRNPFLVTTMETLGVTENRYSGIPRIHIAMREAGLPEPVFAEQRGEFFVCFYNRQAITENSRSDIEDVILQESKWLLAFCAVPRTRKEIASFLNIGSTQYATRRYLEPLIQAGAILLSHPERPKSPKQAYTTNPAFLKAE